MSHPDNLIFTIVPSHFDNLELEAFLELQPADALDIVIASSSGELPGELHGVTRQGWTIAGKGVLNPINLTLSVHESADENILEFKELKTEMVIGGQTISLMGFADQYMAPEFFSESPVEHTLIIPFLQLAGNEIKNAPEWAFFDRFREAGAELFVGINPFEQDGKLVTVYSASTRIARFPIDAFGLSMVDAELRLDVFTGEEQGETGTVAGTLVRSDGDTAFGLRGNLVVLPDSEYLFSVSAPSWQETGFLDLLSWMGILKKEDIEILNSGPLHILNQFFFSRLAGSFTGEDMRPASFEFDAEWHVQNTVFDVSYRYPLHRVTLDLSADAPIALSEIFRAGYNDRQLFPPNAVISGLSLEYGFEDHSFAMGLELKEVWAYNFGHEQFVLEEVRLQLEYMNNGLGGSAEAILKIGELEFSVLAQHNAGEKISGWKFETAFVHSSELKLRNLLSALSRIFRFAAPQHVPDLTVSNMDLSFDTVTHDFHMLLGIDLDKPGIGPFTEGGTMIELDLSHNGDGSHNFTMNLNGHVRIGDAELQMEATNVGQKDWSVDLHWTHREDNPLQVGDVMRFLAGDAGQDFDPDNHPDYAGIKNELALKSLTLTYQHGYEGVDNDPGLAMTILAQLEVGPGDKTWIGLLSGIRAHEENSGWDFLIGVGYENAESIPDTLFQRGHLSHFKLENLWVLVNTAKAPGKEWPPLPDHLPAALTKQATRPGLAVIATMNIAKQEKVPGAGKVFGDHETTEVALMAFANSEGIQMEAVLEGHLSIPTGQGQAIVLEEVMLTLQVGRNISLMLSGEIELKLDDHNQRLTVALDVGLDGIELIVNEKSENTVNTKGWQPFGVDGISIDELGFELGIDFEPPGARIGFEGKMHLPGEKVNADQLAIVMEFVGPIPNPEYFAVAFEEIDFSRILGLFPGSSKEGHAQISKNLVKIERLGLVWCEKPIVLPDGTTGQLGFSLHGAINVFNWAAYLSLEVHPQTGIQGFGEMAPVNLGPLHITGAGTGVSVKQVPDGKGGWKDVSNVTVNGKTDQDARFDTIVEPGGAMIQFNSTASPYLSLSAHMRLFEMELLDIDVEIDNDKARFHLFLQFPPVARFRVDCWIAKAGASGEVLFGISGDFFLGFDLGFDIPFFTGPIHVHILLGIQAALDLERDEKELRFKLKGSLDFFSHKISLLDINWELPGSLKEIPGMISNYLLHGKAKEFSKDVQDGSGANNNDEYSRQRTEAADRLLESARQWAGYVHTDIRELKQERRLSPEEMQAMIDKINRDTERIRSEGEAEVEKIITNSRLESEHLATMKTLVNAETRDADAARRKEMEDMRKETEMIRDVDGRIREQLASHWENSGNDVDRLTQLVRTEMLPEMEKLIRNPQRVLDHHLFILNTREAAAARENEILQTARRNAQAILNEMNRSSFVPEKQQKNHAG